MESIFNVLAEFFRSVNDKKSHWYRVFNPADDEMDCTVMKSTFPSLTALMLMDESYMRELFLHAFGEKYWLHQLILSQNFILPLQQFTLLQQ
jgi:hypothetical protein